MTPSHLCELSTGVQPATGGFLQNLFNTDFVPRAQCVANRPEIVWLHVAADAMIAIAYFSIPIALLALQRRRRDLVFGWMFMMFAAFILACGTTHIFGVLAFWWPMYRFDGLVKAATGLVSITTAVALWPLIPKAVALPSPSLLRSLNARLEEEVATRREAQVDLARINADLEHRVAERTKQLDAVNAQLRLRVAEIESLYKSAAAGLCHLDAGSRVMRANEAFGEFVGLDPLECNGKELAELSPDIADAVQRTPIDPTQAVRVHLRAMGERAPERTVLVNVHYLNTPSGEFEGSALAIMDVSERERLHAQLVQSQKMEAIGQLASGVAHDVSNTLTSVYGYLSLARSMTSPSDPVAEILEKIGLAAEQAARMTRSLLTFARPEPQRRELVEFEQVLSQSLAIVGSTMPANIEIVTEFASAHGAWLVADTTQLQQVVINLALNARDAMPDGGRLFVAARCDARTIRLIVSDTGMGMPPEILARIFDPFFSTKPRGSGTGLGLSVVQGIVRAQQGDIQVFSTPGAGTSFTIEFPRAPAPAGRSPSPQPTAAEGRPGAVVILADDNTHVRDIFALQLRRAGYQVSTATDGEELLLLRKQLPDASLLVVDVDMPRKNGVQAVRELRAAGDTVPIILVTGGNVEETPADKKTTLLYKPFGGKELLHAVAEALAAAQSES